MTSTPTPVRRRIDMALCACFVAVLALPMAGRVFHWAAPYDAQREKRAAAPFPSIEMKAGSPLPRPRKESILAFPHRFEAFFNDRIGFRQELLVAYNSARIAGFVPTAVTASAGRDGGEQVLVGKKNWLYLAGKSCLDMYANRRPFNADELEGWRRGLRARHDWLAERGIAFMFFVAPDKHSIYPEHLPRSIQVRPGDTRLDQLVQRLAAADGVDLLDVRSALRSRRDEHRQYYQGDTHWNPVGAHIAFDELRRRLSRRLPNLETPTADEYELVPAGEVLGDLAMMLQRTSWPEPDNLDVRLRRPSQATFRDEMVSLGDGDYATVRRSTNARLPAGSALVIHDSFFQTLQPWFSEQFRDVTYIKVDLTRFPAELIEEQRPDVVVFELVERYLMNDLPAIELPSRAEAKSFYTAETPSATQVR